jgi:hypothetical protein
MASALYAFGRQHFAQGDLHWKSGGDTFKVTLVDAADYTVNLATDHYMNLDTVPAAAKVATATLTIADAPADGVCDADNTTFTTVTGDVSEALVIWKDGGGGGVTQSGTDDILVAYLDNAKVTGLPATPGGGNIVVTWDNGTSKIFKL